MGKMLTDHTHVAEAPTLEPEAVTRSIASLAKAAGLDPNDLERSDRRVLNPDAQRPSGAFKPGFDPRRHLVQKGEISFTKRQVLEKLRSRAEDVASRFLKTALNELQEGPPCIACGNHAPVPLELQVRAMMGVLDRIGVGVHTNQKHSGKPDSPEGTTNVTLIQNVIVDPRGAGER